jgi:hypothetical protein
MRLALALAAAALCAGCSGEEPAKKPEKPQALQAGQYEVTATTPEIASTDGTTPAVSASAGQGAEPVRGCVADDGALDASLFAFAGETCKETSSYLKRGRLNLQLQCTRPGHGDINAFVEGSFTADGFEGDVTSSSYFAGSGDYRMTRRVAGKRIGNCPTDAGAKQ